MKKLSRILLFLSSGLVAVLCVLIVLMSLSDQHKFSTFTYSDMNTVFYMCFFMETLLVSYTSVLCDKQPNKLIMNVNKNSTLNNLIFMGIIGGVFLISRKLSMLNIHRN